MIDAGKPLLSPQPRRRVTGKPAMPQRQRSLGRDIGHAASETYLLTRLTITLLRYLGYLFLSMRARTHALGLSCILLLVLLDVCIRATRGVII
uniref:Uncharacterized protein n=1 Tax=Rhizophora mucronata TaxID=61149 RepID=A0A2P2MVB8_RHIMU